MTDLSARASLSNGWVARLATRCAAIGGWRRLALAWLLGAVATLSLPPLHGLVALYLTIPVLIWMLAGCRRRRGAFALGWWFGFGYFVTSLYWIGNALLVDGDRFAWMLPFAIAGLPAFLAFYPGLALLVASFGRSHLERALWFAVAWAAMEWLRGHTFTGFPWNLIGHAWTSPDALLQSAAVIGIYGVSFIAVLSAALFAALADTRRVGLPALAAALALLLLPLAGGAVRLALAPAAGTQNVTGVGLRLVQANIPQHEKWMRDYRVRNFNIHLALSLEDRPAWITDVIWPENASTFLIEEDEQARAALAAVAPAGGLLITGGPRRATEPLRLWNSLFAVNGAGAIVGRYDKAHLVPFGEYAPFRDIIPIDKITHGAVDFSPGPGVQTLHLPGLPAVSPLICYEVIFPGAVLDPGDRPEWLLNLTNDAWYGATAGPHQHFALSRVRAVEEGLPLVRAASTGISGIVDAYGRTLQRLAYGRKGVIDAPLPAKLAGITPYARFGEVPFLLLLIGAAAVALTRRLRSDKQNASVIKSA